jgi:hypothetical protein
MEICLLEMNFGEIEKRNTENKKWDIPEKVFTDI